MSFGKRMVGTNTKIREQDGECIVINIYPSTVVQNSRIMTHNLLQTWTQKVQIKVNT